MRRACASTTQNCQRNDKRQRKHAARLEFVQHNDKTSKIHKTPVRPPARPSARPSVRRPSFCPPARPSVRPSVRPPVRPPVRPSARPSTRPSVRPSIRPSVRPSARPPIRPPVRPPARPPVGHRGSKNPNDFVGLDFRRFVLRTRAPEFVKVHFDMSDVLICESESHNF